jgi:hypothetical protein
MHVVTILPTIKPIQTIIIHGFLYAVIINYEGYNAIVL